MKITILNLLENIKTLSDLLRVRNCLMAFFGVLIGATLAYSNVAFMPNLEIIAAGIAAFLIMGAGNAMNDFFDVEIDRINKPHRPIPSGRISKSDAMMLSLSLFMIGIAIAKYINFYALLIALANSVILIVYAKYSKRLLLISNIGVSYLVASIFIFGVVSVDAFYRSEIKIISIIMGSAFLMTFSREIIKDIEDMEGDKRKYSVTLPIVIGVERSRIIAWIFAISAILSSIIPFFVNLLSFNLYVYGILISIADAVFLLALTKNPAMGQKMMIFGMSLALFAFLLGNLF